MDIDVYFGFAVLVLATVMICYLGWKGRLDSRPVFVLMPTATLAAAAITLFVRVEGHTWLFVTVVLVMVAAFLILLVVIGVSAVASMFRGREKVQGTERQVTPNDGREHDFS